MRTGFPCNESRVFPVGIDLQGFPVSYTGFGFAVCLQLYKYTGTSVLTQGFSKLVKINQVSMGPSNLGL